VYQNFISNLYKAQHVSVDTLPIIRSLKLHKQPLVLHKWGVVGRVVVGRVVVGRVVAGRSSATHTGKILPLSLNMNFLGSQNMHCT
jgi:hypothetical protein